MKRHSLIDDFGSFGTNQRSTTSLRRAAQSPEVRPIVVEGLEGRRMLSVSISQNTTTNTLIISGDANVNYIEVYQLNKATDEIYVIVDSTTPHNGPWYVGPDLTFITFFGEGDADTFQPGTITWGGFTSDPDEIPVSVPAELHGGYGNDTLTGTDGPDDIFGDYGIDDLWGARGDDEMYGGYGDDSDGAVDTFHGEEGADKIFGEGGNDSLWGGAGADQMYGGAGDDTFHAGGDSAVDYLAGGDGTDTGIDRDQNDNHVSVEVLS